MARRSCNSAKQHFYTDSLSTSTSQTIRSEEPLVAFFFLINFHMSQINSFIKHNNGKLIGKKKNYSSSWHCFPVPALSPQSPCYCPFSQCVGLPCLVVKNPPANVGKASSISGSGRSPGEGSSRPLQYFCLGSPMDRGAWRAALHRLSKSWT